jgi:hypothetical protein
MTNRGVCPKTPGEIAEDTTIAKQTFRNLMAISSRARISKGAQTDMIV